ncbi:unnamed protein product [Kuraishia capsulata CBS 1993]|uniref:Nicotinamide-nucleotide adenylyltransferase n=1 Tax=Kuraishia capsulata CBS 1993 TaxID=1382522 RepID=W6MKH2_9ASCO|nr:uncharacterized protein KUCA_T00002981001 [Kuraishia capsulata CBS 1993]CDK27004.1 unnamed protein product [Kuraishia capsulata CBS 1993]
MPKLKQELESFLKDGVPFRIIYSTSSAFVTRSTSRICILDSSFNPPHRGHYSLAENAIHYDFPERNARKDAHDKSNRSLLLLLSVKNADKVVQPAAFADRIAMMISLADFAGQSLKVPVALGLTSHAKFVDKATAIGKTLTEEYRSFHPTEMPLTFLMGFDTLIRVFDPKYYTPASVRDSLSSFMDLSELFVLTRDDGLHSLDDQKRYIENIRLGKTDTIPKEWYSKIHMVDGQKESTAISSSALRRSISSKEDSSIWKPYTIDAISEYITAAGLYRPFPSGDST